MDSTGFWWILIAVAVYGALHSLLASLTVKGLAERLFGAVGKRGYRLFFNVVAVISLAPVFILMISMPDRMIYRIPFPWALLARAGQLLGTVGLILGVFQTGAANFIGIEQVIDPEKGGQRRMTVSGLYRWVRHPLYTCGLLILWLTPVMSWNIFAFNLAATLYITIGAWLEERKLRLEFGAAYDEYCRRMPMLIPGFNRKPRK
ncbi:MAG: isoprenylcysteine carboxylmethyltransferase family protein [Anaerolineaceae bacterium]|nr:isoprenylcysteine carboxylmethyltransferase family protein [Anaerolineaceae bacterium]